MKSLYQAYQAYECRAERGEFSTRRTANVHSEPAFYGPLLAQFGDLLIHTGLKLKRRYTTGKSMAWSPMTGNKP